MTRSVLSLHARAGRREELLERLDDLELTLALSYQPGFLRVEVQSELRDENDVVVVGSWASAEHCELWQRTPTYRRLLDELEPLLDGGAASRTYRVLDAVG